MEILIIHSVREINIISKLLASLNLKHDLDEDHYIFVLVVSDDNLT